MENTTLRDCYNALLAMDYYEVEFNEVTEEQRDYIKENYKLFRERLGEILKKYRIVVQDYSIVKGEKVVQHEVFLEDIHVGDELASEFDKQQIEFRNSCLKMFRTTRDNKYARLYREPIQKLTRCYTVLKLARDKEKIRRVGSQDTVFVYIPADPEKRRTRLKTQEEKELVLKFTGDRSFFNKVVSDCKVEIVTDEN